MSALIVCIYNYTHFACGNLCMAVSLLGLDTVAAAWEDIYREREKNFTEDCLPRPFYIMHLVFALYGMFVIVCL